MKTLEKLIAALPHILSVIFEQENQERFDDFVENFEDVLLLVNKSAGLAVEAAMDVYEAVEAVKVGKTRSIKNTDEQRAYDKMRILFQEKVNE